MDECSQLKVLWTTMDDWWCKQGLAGRGRKRGDWRKRAAEEGEFGGRCVVWVVCGVWVEGERGATAGLDTPTI